MHRWLHLSLCDELVRIEGTLSCSGVESYALDLRSATLEVHGETIHEDRLAVTDRMYVKS